MIDENPDSTSDHSAADEELTDEISKSQRKRDADAVRRLGESLAELGASELATVPLSEDVLAAIRELNRLKAHGARKRQLGFLAKRLRLADLAPIEDALERLRQSARANTMSHHLVEKWRDRLLGDVEGESGKDALTAFLGEFVDADRQLFRHLQRQALAEREAQKPPAAARQLFKAIREVVVTTQPTPGNLS